MRTTILVLIYFSNLCYTVSQGENNNWYIGDGAFLDFNVSPPKIKITIPEQDIIDCTQSTSISNSNGDLRYYVLNNYIYNKHHQKIENSFVRGEFFSVFVPHPTNNDLIFVFYLDNALSERNPGKLYYSVIDDTLNDGLGGIHMDNYRIPLHGDFAGGKMVVIQGECGFVWVVVHEMLGNSFHAYKIDGNGVNPESIKSNSGSDLSYLECRLGKIAASPDGKWLWLRCDLSPLMELHKFDNATGTIFNAINLTPETNTSTASVGCFSEDNSKLYAFEFDRPNDVGSYYQWDIVGDDNSFQASKTLLTTISGERPPGDMERGPDGIIYISDVDNFDPFENHIHAILNPNLAGVACNLTIDYLSFPKIDNGCPSVSSLNNFVVVATETVTYDEDLLPADQILCINDNLTLNVSPFGESFKWQDGSLKPTYTLSKEGKYWVDVVREGCTFTDTIIVTYYSDNLDLGDDITQCGQSFLTSLSSNINADSYLWNTGETTPQIEVSTSGTYWLETRIDNCTQRDTIKVFYDDDELIINAMIQDCIEQIYGLSSNIEAERYLWSTGEITRDILVEYTDTYWLEVQNGNCTYSDSIDLRIDEFNINLPQDTSICKGDTLSISIANPKLTLQWQDGYIGTPRLLTESGTYAYTISTADCDLSNDISLVIDDCGPSDCNVYIPNAISVNAMTSENKSLRIYANCEVDMFHIQIFDRWGNLIHIGTNPELPWEQIFEGERISLGVYIIKLSYRLEGENNSKVVYETLSLL